MASPAALSLMDAPFCQVAKAASSCPDMASPISVHVKDASKRKRVNRNAKLKQCKLDARREQWLSQVSTVTHGKTDLQEPHKKIPLVEEQNKDGFGEVVHPENHGSPSLGAGELQQYTSDQMDKASSCSHLRIRRPQNCEEEDLSKEKLSPSGSSSCMSDCSEAVSSPKSCGSESPKSKVTRVEKDYRIDRGRSTSEFEEEYSKENGNCSGSSYASATLASNEHPLGHISENDVTFPNVSDNSKLNADSHVSASHKSEEHGLEAEDDDWEAAADALHLNHLRHVVRNTSLTQKMVEREGNLNSQHSTLTVDSKLATGNNIPDPYGTMSRSASGRAWRPDDVYRPTSLPSLNKQQSLPAHFICQKQQCVSARKVTEEPPTAVPSLCPICAEELDNTDSSFEPCSCGFQLCLFCHHRIASDDGRCPGCRKFYSTLLPAKSIPSPSLC